MKEQEERRLKIDDRIYGAIAIEYGHNQSITLEDGMSIKDLCDVLALAYKQGYEAAKLALKDKS